MNGMEHLQADPPLNAAQLSLVAHLTHVQVEAIDNALAMHCTSSWRKVSLVVGSALEQVQLAGVPDVFFAQRVKEHVARGKLEARGDLARMHYSEVRVPIGSGANAT